MQPQLRRLDRGEERPHNQRLVIVQDELRGVDRGIRRDVLRAFELVHRERVPAYRIHHCTIVCFNGGDKRSGECRIGSNAA